MIWKDLCIRTTQIITNTMQKFKNIILATDFSDNAKTAYLYAKGLATQFGAAIQVVHFFERPIIPATVGYPNLSSSSDDVNDINDMADIAQKQFEQLIYEHNEEHTRIVRLPLLVLYHTKDY